MKYTCHLYLLLALNLNIDQVQKWSEKYLNPEEDFYAFLWIYFTRTFNEFY